MKETRKPLSTVFYYNLVFVAVVLVFSVYALLFTDVFNREYAKTLRYFSDNWRDSSGLIYNLDKDEIKDYVGKVTLANRLPDDLSDSDSLCFLSKNTNVKVYMNAEVIYSYEAKENLTGIGYGTVFHSVPLTGSDKGKSVILELSRVNIKAPTGESFMVYVGPTQDYIHMLVMQNSPALFLTLLIIFFGLVIIIIWIGITNKEDVPMDILNLGLGTWLMGLWLLSGMPVAQATSGVTIVWRFFHRMFVFLLPYPFVRFINSSTRQKRRVYEYIAFYVTMSGWGAIIGLRFLADIDMIRSFLPFELAIAAITFLLIVIILLDDRRYCKRNAMPSRNQGIYIAVIEAFVCCVIEIIVYRYDLWEHHEGTFVRIGMVLFMSCVSVQLINWWMQDQAGIDKERFNSYALSLIEKKGGPTENIKTLLEYMTKELGGSRGYIFEKTENERFGITYEWFGEGLDPMPREKLELSGENFEEEFLKKMNLFKEGNTCRCIKSEGKIIGILGINSIEENRVRNVDEIMDSIVYFFAGFIVRRKEQELLFYYNYHDPVSGARNRSAMREFAEHQMNYAQPFGYVVCEVAGLREINDNLRNENTEQILRNTAECLMDAFGDNNVFAVSGEEFVCFGFENDEYYFINDVKRAKKLLKEKNCKTFIGASYCANGTTDIMNVVRYTRGLMEKDREEQKGQ